MAPLLTNQSTAVSLTPPFILRDSCGWLPKWRVTKLVHYSIFCSVSDNGHIKEICTAKKKKPELDNSDWWK